MTKENSRSQSTELRVLLVEDNEEVRSRLSSAIGTDSDLVVWGEARSVQEAIALLAVDTPDVALIDLGLPDGGGVQ